MPNFFRNSPIDSLTSSVNSLRRRQMESQETQVRMMQVNSELEQKDAERRLLPKRLELESTKLEHEMKLQEVGMNLEVIKTAQSVQSERLKNGIMLEQALFDRQKRPYELEQLMLETESSAVRYTYLEAMMEAGLIKTVQQNTFNALDILGRSMNMFATTLGQLGAQIEDAQTTRDESAQVWGQSMFGQSWDSKPKFQYPALHELHQSYLIQNPDASPEAFAAHLRDMIFSTASDIGGFTNAQGEFTNPSDPDMAKALEEAASKVFKEKILQNLLERKSKDRNYSAAIARYNELEAADITSLDDDQTAELEKLRKGLIDSVHFKDGRFSYKGYGALPDKPVQDLLWPAFFGSPEVTANARTYMESTNKIGTRLVFQNVIMGIIQEGGESGLDLLAGKSPGKDKALSQVRESKAAYEIEKEKFLEVFNENWNDDADSIINRIIANPEAFGISGVDGDQALADILHPVKEVLPSPNE